MNPVTLLVIGQEVFCLGVLLLLWQFGRKEYQATRLTQLCLKLIHERQLRKKRLAEFLNRSSAPKEPDELVKVAFQAAAWGSLDEQQEIDFLDKAFSKEERRFKTQRLIVSFCMVLVLCGTVLQALAYIPINRYAVVAYPQASSTFGRAEIVDPHTFVVDGRRIRLFGIDSPPKCARDGVAFNCDEEAVNSLRSFVDDRSVRCEFASPFWENAAICYAGSVNLNEWLVQNGWALAWLKDGDYFLPLEDRARRQELGIWQKGVALPRAWWESQHAQDRKDSLIPTIENF